MIASMVAVGTPAVQFEPVLQLVLVVPFHEVCASKKVLEKIRTTPKGDLLLMVSIIFPFHHHTLQNLFSPVQLSPDLSVRTYYFPPLK